MNDFEKAYLREHWSKPGRLRALLSVLPMALYDRNGGGNLKLVVSMTGIDWGLTELAQVYYMLEEDGVLVREGEPPEPEQHLQCTHLPKGNCPKCHFEKAQRAHRATIRYRLSKPLDEF